ncbi:unnamed protein product [Amaranthus hypochondriacus]
MKDDWFSAAITDDNIVAGLLLRLKESPSPSSSTTSIRPASFILKPLPPSWGLRLPRSKPNTTSSSSHVPVVCHGTKKRRESTRRSPTTPLSWSCGGASPSDGCDESLSSHHIQPPPSDRFRSKITASTETPSTITSKRPRRKKTFAELKEEENSLLKERTLLKKELASIHLSVKEQRSINENLKRIKLDLQVESQIKSEANSVDERNNNNTNNRTSEAACSSVTRQANKTDDSSEPESQKRTTSQESLFVLPDLNMAPEEDTTGGMS